MSSPDWATAEAPWQPLPDGPREPAAQSRDRTSSLGFETAPDDLSPHRKSSDFQAYMTVTKLYAGTGMIAFPYAVSQAGLVAAIVGLVVVGWLNNYALRLLVKCKWAISKELGAHVEVTYQDVAEHAFGDTGRTVCVVSVVSSLLGICIAYLIFIVQVGRCWAILSLRTLHTHPRLTRPGAEPLPFPPASRPRPPPSAPPRAPRPVLGLSAPRPRSLRPRRAGSARR